MRSQLHDSSTWSLNIVVSSSAPAGPDATHSCICWYLEGVMTSSSASTGIRQPVGNMAARAAIRITADGLTPTCVQATSEAIGSKPGGTWCESCSCKVAYMLEIPRCWTRADCQAMLRSTCQLAEQFQVRVIPRQENLVTRCPHENPLSAMLCEGCSSCTLALRGRPACPRHKFSGAHLFGLCC